MNKRVWIIPVLLVTVIAFVYCVVKSRISSSKRYFPKYRGLPYILLFLVFLIAFQTLLQDLFFIIDSFGDDRNVF